MGTTVQVSASSANRKTGPIPTTMRGPETCPASCPFRPDGAIGGCYGTGRQFGMAVKLELEMSADDIAAKVGKGQRPTRWAIARDRVVGDIDDGNGGIDREHLETVAAAFQTVGRVVYGYTHHLEVTAADVPDNYVMNASCETVDDIRDAWRRGLPAVIAGDDVPSDVDGTRVVTCPATQREDTDCSTCGLCARQTRMTDPAAAPIIHFPLHGTAVKRARAAVAARNVGA